MSSIKQQMSRRSFMQTLAAALAAISLSPPLSWAADKTLIRKAIPGTDETLPVIGLGTSRTFDVGSDKTSLSSLVDVLQAFFDNGGEVIDSSPMYGSAEQVIGTLLRRLPQQKHLFAATKVWTDGRQNGIRQMEASAKKWGVPHFDLLQVHNLNDWDTHLNTLKRWKVAEKVRYIGITTSHGLQHEDMLAIMRNEPLDFVQFSYNLKNRAAEERLLPLAAERGIAVMTNRPYFRGELFHVVSDTPLPDWAAEFDCASWGQFFLKFVVSHPAVTCVIPATSKVHHMQDNMAAGFGRLPDAATRTRMAEYFAAL